MKIPGWAEVGEADVQKALEAGELSYQRVHGKWFEIDIGFDALEKLIDDYIEAMVYIWGSTKFYCAVNGWNATTSDGRMAFRILKEWGILDENGDSVAKAEVLKTFNEHVIPTVEIIGESEEAEND